VVSVERRRSKTHLILEEGGARYAHRPLATEKPPTLTRQIVLDTETTGLEPGAGHRIIEIGCVELVNRKPTSNRFHRYINPEREVDRGALEVHGIENDFLSTQPKFADVAAELVDFLSGAELVIHNADFDVEFLNCELKRLPGMPQEIRDRCGVLDTLALARRMHPGQRNTLDALAKRYNVDNSKRELHGALLDAQILADIYLAMTGGQVSLSLESEPTHAATAHPIELRLDRGGLVLPVIRATPEEERAHEAMLAAMAKRVQPIWHVLQAAADAASPQSAAA
jgi:DNA polymerase-3 subunit epsilon